MLYENITPEDYVERVFCEQIYLCLDQLIPSNDVEMVVRAWMQPPTFPTKKYISVVTSAEGHQYIPPEREDPGCLGVFMHYYPKPSVADQFDPDKFVSLENVYPLPLGETKFFKGDNLKPILQRDIDVAFVGQFDPYRRADFYIEIERCSNKIENSVFHFYEGWNNGIGEKYSEIMSNTKVALVPRGTASLDTFRYYEACKCGCIVMSCPQNKYEFMEHPPHIDVPEWRNLDLGLNVLFQNKNLFSTGSRITREFWEKNLSPSGAANFIFKKVKEKL